MAAAPVATAAAGDPSLSMLVSVVRKAGLIDSLNSAPALTVFAPVNDAFAKVPSAVLKQTVSDKRMLTNVLAYHELPGRLSPDQLAGTHKSLQGGTITVTGSGTSFKINGTASVICGNVQTANATLYMIDTVLLPKG